MESGSDSEQDSIQQEIARIRYENIMKRKEAMKKKKPAGGSNLGDLLAGSGDTSPTTAPPSQRKTAARLANIVVHA